MLTTKLRIAALLVLTIIILAVGGVLIPRGSHGDAAPAPAPPKVPKEMLEKRLVEATKVWEIYWQLWRQAPKSLRSDLFGWSERLLEAQLALLDKQEGRMKAFKAHVDRTRLIEQLAIAGVNHARGSPFDVHKASYERINAEIRYFQETGKVPPPPPKSKEPEGERLDPPKEKKEDLP